MKTVVALFAVVLVLIAVGCIGLKKHVQPTRKASEFVQEMQQNFQEKFATDKTATEIASGTITLAVAPDDQVKEVSFFAWYDERGGRVSVAIDAEASKTALSGMVKYIIRHPGVVLDENPHIFLLPLTVVMEKESSYPQWSGHDGYAEVVGDHGERKTLLWLEYESSAEAMIGLPLVFKKLKDLGAIKGSRGEKATTK